MAELVVDLFVTVDGYAKGTRSEAFFGLLGPELAAWIDAEQAGPQVLLMGRVTYEQMAGMSRDSTEPGAVRMTETPKAVVSGTLAEPLDWAGTRLVDGADLAAGVGELKRTAAGVVRTIGSPTLVSGLLRAGLVDRLRLMVFPQVLGETGAERILADLPDLDLVLESSRVLDSRLVLLEYRPVSSG